MEAERRLISAQAEAQAAKLSGFAEAEVMRAKGYTEKDVLQAEVQKAYAEGLGNMGANGGGGGIVGDFVGLGAGLAAAGTIGNQMSEMFKGLSVASASETKTEQPTTGGFCIHCGAKLPENARFCPGCGNKLA